MIYFLEIRILLGFFGGKYLLQMHVMDREFKIEIKFFGRINHDVFEGVSIEKIIT